MFILYLFFFIIEIFSFFSFSNFSNVYASKAALQELGHLINSGMINCSEDYNHQKCYAECRKKGSDFYFDYSQGECKALLSVDGKTCGPDISEAHKEQCIDVCIEKQGAYQETTGKCIVDLYLVKTCPEGQKVTETNECKESILECPKDQILNQDATECILMKCSIMSKVKMISDSKDITKLGCEPLTWREIFQLMIGTKITECLENKEIASDSRCYERLISLTTKIQKKKELTNEEEILLKLVDLIKLGKKCSLKEKIFFNEGFLDSKTELDSNLNLKSTTDVAALIRGLIGKLKCVSCPKGQERHSYNPLICELSGQSDETQSKTQVPSDDQITEPCEPTEYYYNNTECVTELVCKSEKNKVVYTIGSGDTEKRICGDCPPTTHQLNGGECIAKAPVDSSQSQVSSDDQSSTNLIEDSSQSQVSSDDQSSTNLIEDPSQVSSDDQSSTNLIEDPSQVPSPTDDITSTTNQKSTWLDSLEKDPSQGVLNCLKKVDQVKCNEAVLTPEPNMAELIEIAEQHLNRCEKDEKIALKDEGNLLSQIAFPKESPDFFDRFKTEFRRNIECNSCPDGEKRSENPFICKIILNQSKMEDFLSYMDENQISVEIKMDEDEQYLIIEFDNKDKVNEFFSGITAQVSENDVKNVIYKMLLDESENHGFIVQLRDKFLGPTDGRRTDNKEDYVIESYRHIKNHRTIEIGLDFIVKKLKDKKVYDFIIKAFTTEQLLSFFKDSLGTMISESEESGNLLTIKFPINIDVKSEYYTKLIKEINLDNLWNNMRKLNVGEIATYDQQIRRRSYLTSFLHDDEVAALRSAGISVLQIRIGAPDEHRLSFISWMYEYQKANQGKNILSSDAENGTIEKALYNALYPAIQDQCKDATTGEKEAIDPDTHPYYLVDILYYYGAKNSDLYLIYATSYENSVYHQFVKKLQFDQRTYLKRHGIAGSSSINIQGSKTEFGDAEGQLFETTHSGRQKLPKPKRDFDSSHFRYIKLKHFISDAVVTNLSNLSAEIHAVFRLFDEFEQYHYISYMKDKIALMKDQGVYAAGGEDDAIVKDFWGEIYRKEFIDKELFKDDGLGSFGFEFWEDYNRFFTDKLSPLSGLYDHWITVLNNDGKSYLGISNHEY